MMTTDPQLALVTAHVLFIDIVDYSTKATEEQHRLVQELQELVRWMHLFNLYTTEVGNPRVPEKLRSGGWGFCQPPSPAVDAPSKRHRTKPQRLRVALLYEGGAATAQNRHVLQLLQTVLGERGHRVFVDRHLDVGIGWAREIDDQIRASDVIIPLLSASSAESEMLAHELQTAHEAAQAQYGRPALLPVRVDFTDPLPASLDAILDPWEGAVWAGPEDDERLVTQVLDALGRPLKRVVPPERLPSISGAMPLDSRYYVARPADQQLGAALARGDGIILVKGARQMGKTSLLARGLQQAREQGARVVQSDFQKLAAAHLESPEAFFLKLAGSIADQLDLAVAPEDVWTPHRDPAANFERFWRRECLGASEAPIVWGLDEVDRLFGRPFSSEVFGLFRAWHNGRALEPDAPWHRLTLLIAYATEANLFIRDLTQSPFNVGTKVTLDDFTPAQVVELNARYGSPLRDEVELRRFTRLLGGHPYLVHRGLHQMITTGLDLDRFEAQADREDGIYGDHLRRILTVLARDRDLCAAVRGVLRGEPCLDDASFFRLCSGGLMVGSARYAVCPRCRVYVSYLSRHLL